MTEPIDHRAEAVRLARLVEQKAVTPSDYAAAALINVQLASIAPSWPADDPYWTQAHELDKLRDAVQEVHRSAIEGRKANRVEVGIAPYSRLIELAGL